MGERIQAARKAAGLTQTELGQRVGVRQQLVARWETGENNPKLHHLVALAGALRMTTDQLLGVAPMPAGAASVEAAIIADPSLTASFKTSLLQAYRSALALDDEAS